MKPQHIAVVGAGAWGTALSVMWAKRGHEIVLWGKNASRIKEIQRSRQNSAYLPGVKLPGNICLTSEIQDCASADLIVFVTRSTALRETASALRNVQINPKAVLLSCTKGIEHGSGKRMTEILAEIFPEHIMAAMSGPNLAAEVSHGLPTATVLACSQSDRKSTRLNSSHQ